jgi:hypothetical protein
VHLLELLIAERARQVDAGDFRADKRGLTLSLRAERSNLAPAGVRLDEIASSLRSSQ